MRVRNRKGATELLEANPQYVVLNPLEAKGKWRDLFGNDNPIHVEVGSGKGAFVSGMAKQNPDINYIGIDIQKSVLSYALDKVLEVGVPNIKLLWVDGSDLTDYFEDGEIDRLYLNFSDPWPKKRHEKRRLTYKTFLDTFKRILPENGEIHFINHASNLTEIEVGKLFDRFYTVNNARNSTGLGLSISKALVEKMNGTISAEYNNEMLNICIVFDL